MQKQENKSPGSCEWAKARSAISSRTKSVTFVGMISALQKILWLLFFHIPHIERMMAQLAALIQWRSQELRRGGANSKMCATGIFFLTTHVIHNCTERTI